VALGDVALGDVAKAVEGIRRRIPVVKNSIRSHLRILDLERPLKPDAVSPSLLAWYNSSALETS
jgi:hypothetical protein